MCITNNKYMRDKSIEPLCKLRAESIEDKNLRISDYFISARILIPKSCNEDIDSLSELKHRSTTEFTLYLRINIYDSIHVIQFTEELCEYLINNYNISNLDELIDIELSFTVKSDSRIKIDDEIISEIEKDDILDINDAQMDYASDISNELQDEFFETEKNNFMDDINEKIKNLWYKNNFIGEGKIINYKNKLLDGDMITNLTISNGANRIEFTLEYPPVYNEQNNIIEFINKVGGGSVEGLKDEYVSIVDENSVDNPIATKNGVCITGKSDKNQRKNTLEEKFVFNIYFCLILISMVITIIGISNALIYLSVIGFIVTLFMWYIWVCFTEKYID